MKRSCSIVIGVMACIAAAVAGTSPSFPRPPELEPDIHFWTRVYTEVDSRAGLLHDARYLDVVYEAIHFPDGLSKKAQIQYVKSKKEYYRQILKRLAQGRRNDLQAAEQRVLDLWSEDVSKRTLRTAARRIRFQLGQADRFRKGLIRSGAWEDYIRNTLAAMDLPKALAALPHVESSYNPMAYSRVGAAGLWQFTRSTGRRYLRIDHVVDERLDPYRSTIAAARLLKHNRAVTGSWPLAITAYNHGAAGMRRAVRELGTNDITTILRRYDGPTFGFASRNFYVAFLAAVDVANNAETYFGSLQKHPPEEHEHVKLPTYVSIQSLLNGLGIKRSALKEANPALRSAVWRGVKHVPQGYPLGVPRASVPGSVKTLIASIASTEGFADQIPDRTYRVRRGDTLSGIGAQFDVSVSELVELNMLRNRHTIRVGQVLQLLPSESGSPVASEASANLGDASPASGEYIVRRGDTISSIARRFDLEMDALLEANGIRHKHRIYAGQVLQVAMAPAERNGQQMAASAERVRQEGEPDTDGPEEPNLSIAEIAEMESAEPVSAEEAEALGPTLPPAVHPALVADPSDYTVADDHTIEVQAAETLGHYAEWLGLRASHLRRINGMRYGQPVVIGGRLKLHFSKVGPDSFERRRIAYHRLLQEAFFAEFRISGTHAHKIKPGEAVWILSQRRYDVPIWLLHQYNPDLDLSALRAGTSITIPRIERRSDEQAPLVQQRQGVPLNS